jgi:hypothetical protein
MLENRVKLLKEQEESLKVKEDLQKRQIANIMLIRKRAHEERQLQEQRR